MDQLGNIFLLSCLGGGCVLRDGPIVETPLGKIRGSYQTSYDGNIFSAFEGIPYAQPPIGKLRFEAPRAVKSWMGIWDANFTINCAQSAAPFFNSTQVDEDCLYLNVYVPRKQPSSEDKLDVVVHIHGGAFMYGSSHWYAGPDYLMDREVILVTLNYRLGILGFLSTEDSVVPGNMGLKDQVIALKWVRRNIVYFGGKPNSVTITGASAGGSSVHLHYFSDMSKNLFKRGISHSGVALNTFVFQKEALNKTQRLAEAVGCPNSNNVIMVECLKQRPYHVLLNNMKLFYELPYIPIAPFAPVIEKNSPNPFIKEHPFVLLHKKKIHDLPWVVSNTPHEGLLPIMYDLGINIINLFWESFAPTLLDFDKTVSSSLWDNTTQKIKEFYLKNEQVDDDNFYDFVQIFTDRAFLVDAETAVRWQSKDSNSSVYYYRFNYIGDNNKNKTVRHCEDMRYFFDVKIKPLTSNEVKMKDVMLDMLMSYVKTGKPQFKGVEWEPTKPDQLTYLDVDGPDDIKLKKTKNLTPRTFWKSLGFSENENLIPDLEEL